LTQVKAGFTPSSKMDRFGMQEAIMMWWWNDGWSMPWAFGPFMMIVVIVLCVTMMFFMMRMMGGHVDRSGDRITLDILKQRFARGEITQAEYEERRRLLEV
jgi:putative membrane protein